MANFSIRILRIDLKTCESFIFFNSRIETEYAYLHLLLGRKLLAHGVVVEDFSLASIFASGHDFSKPALGDFLELKMKANILD